MIWQSFPQIVGLVCLIGSCAVSSLIAARWLGQIIAERIIR